MTTADWTLYEFLFGHEAMLRARAGYERATTKAAEQARKDHRRRVAVATAFYAVSGALVLGALHGFILLVIAGYDGVIGSL